MNDQLERHKARRAANTLPDSTRPYAWWKRYQRRISETKAMTEAEIQRDAARQARTLDELTEEYT
jgi:hypothetical protein